jgi:hypothetical protein
VATVLMLGTRMLSAPVASAQAAGSAAH